MDELEVRLQLVEVGRVDRILGPQEGIVVGEEREEDAEEEARRCGGFGQPFVSRFWCCDLRPTIMNVAKDEAPV